MIGKNNVCVYVYTLKDFFVPIISNRYLKSHYNPIQSHQIPLITTKSLFKAIAFAIFFPFFISASLKTLFPFAILSHSP